MLPRNPRQQATHALVIRVIELLEGLCTVRFR
jgi:hypothetical protein